MEVLFENVYTDTEEVMKELYRQRSKVRRWLFAVLFSFYTMVYIHLVRNDGNILYWIFLFVCGGYAIFYLFYPTIVTKRYFKNMKKHYDGKVPETRILCTEEDITVWFGKDCGHLSYDKITKIYFYRNIIELQEGKMKRATLLQDAFTKGTKGEFLEFLRVKCPNLTIPE